MSQLISSIDPIIAVYLVFGIAGLVIAIVVPKFYIPDSEWRKMQRRKRSTVHRHV